MANKYDKIGDLYRENDATSLSSLGITATAAELNYMAGVTGPVQAQIDGKAAALTSDQNYVSDAQLAVIQNTSGVNTGDQDLSSYLTIASAAATYEPLKGADDNYVTDAEKVKLSNLSGTNTGDVTVTDSAEIDFTLTGQDITAVLKASSIDETKLDASVYLASYESEAIRDENGEGGSEEYVRKELEKLGIPWEERSNYNLEHITPVKAGGTTNPDNLFIVDRATHESYTPVDVLAAQKIKAGLITRREVTKIMIDLKVKKIINIEEAKERLNK